METEPLKDVSAGHRDAPYLGSWLVPEEEGEVRKCAFAVSLIEHTDHATKDPHEALLRQSIRAAPRHHGVERLGPRGGVLSRSTPASPPGG